ncbi:transcription termination factor Rho, partial [Candidatus Curtissbacteria bacterium]|nr:transcription termination factor Rho [Candidatus Curtissbacteria bacterium]
MPTKVQVKVRKSDGDSAPAAAEDTSRVIDLRSSGRSSSDAPAPTPAPAPTYESQPQSRPSYDSQGPRERSYDRRPSSGGRDYRGGNNGGYQRDFDEPRKVVRDVYEGSGSSYGESERDVPTQEVSGILDVAQDGHGFLRPKFRPSDGDVYVSSSQIRKFGLRAGDFVKGMGRPPKESERYYGLLKVEEVNEVNAEKQGIRVKFEDLTPIYPNKKLKLEIGKAPLSNRIIDIIAPIGMGQRGMIVSPPKAGKTTVLKDLARGISENFPKVHLMAALIGERPEEVTDISRSVKGEVIASNFDEPAEDQTRVAEIALDRAKRLVEKGLDVVILLDSITRLARAYNLSVPPSGRTLTGGFDPAALYPPKRF